MNEIERLAGVVAPEVLLDAIRLTTLLTELHVPHVLVGGLAVGMNGHPRATRDVDFLVGAEAFAQTTPILVYRDELTELIRMGVINLLAVPDAYPVLSEQLRVPGRGELPVIALEALVLMKLLRTALKTGRTSTNSFVSAAVGSVWRTTSVSTRRGCWSGWRAWGRRHRTWRRLSRRPPTCA